MVTGKFGRLRLIIQAGGDEKYPRIFDAQGIAHRRLDHVQLGKGITAKFLVIDMQRISGHRQGLLGRLLMTRQGIGIYLRAIDCWLSSLKFGLAAR